MRGKHIPHPGRMMVMLLTFALILHKEVLAQSVVLDTADIESVLDELAITDPVMVIDHLTVRKFGTGQEKQGRIHSAALTKLMLSLLGQRLVTANGFGLDKPVRDLMPHIIEANPFDRAVTFRHLLQETAGYATPPHVLTKGQRGVITGADRLKRFMIKLRSPDQLSVHDPVGWAVLVHSLQTLADAPLQEITDQHFIAPMGLEVADVRVSFNRLSGSSMPVVFSFTGEAVTALLRLALRNRTDAEDTYVPRSLHTGWLSGEKAHQIHPAAQQILAGLTRRHGGANSVLIGLNVTCAAGPAFALLPRAGTAVLILNRSKSAACVEDTAHEFAETASTRFLPPNPRPATYNLAEPSTLSGRYVRADTTPAWLSERLDQMQNDWFTVSGNPQIQLDVRTSRGTRTRHIHVAPYVFAVAGTNADKTSLVFSPFKLGGYVLEGDQSYRRIDVLGLAALYEHLVPALLIILLSGFIYSVTMKDHAWRNMGRFAAVGALLIAIGLYLEQTAWPYVLYEIEQSWLVNLWRTGLNIGLMAVLTVPMFTVIFSRDSKIPAGSLEPLIKTHLLLMSGAAMAILLMLVSWGIAGTFSAY